MSMQLKRQNMLTITFAALMAAVLSNCWLLTNVSYAVPLSPATQLPGVKITFPHKSQQIRVGSNILVSGISSPPPGVSHAGCTVSVLLNDVKPYQKTVALGPTLDSLIPSKFNRSFEPFLGGGAVFLHLASKNMISDS
jgi:hypothetical protein